MSLWMQLALHSRFFVSGSHYDMAYAKFPLPGEVRHPAALHSAVWLSTDKLNLLEESMRWHCAGALAVICTNGLFLSFQTRHHLFWGNVSLHREVKEKQGWITWQESNLPQLFLKVRNLIIQSFFDCCTSPASKIHIQLLFISKHATKVIPLIAPSVSTILTQGWVWPLNFFPVCSKWLWHELSTTSSNSWGCTVGSWTFTLPRAWAHWGLILSLRDWFFKMTTVIPSRMGFPKTARWRQFTAL